MIGGTILISVDSRNFMGTRINFRAHANKTRLQKFNFPCSTVGTEGSPLIPTSVRKESNGRKDVLLFLSNLFFRPIRFDRTRDRGFFEIPLVEIKISTRRCISGRERGGGRNGRIGRFCEDRSGTGGGNFHRHPRNYRRPFILPLMRGITNL